ncbi:MAG: aminoacyl-tRNA hydrolase [Flavobacteriales bacterium Tduv]
MKKFLIAGLGNMGAMYEKTRHNIGFKVLDTLVNMYSSSFVSETLGSVAQIQVKGKCFILLQPDTYMNLSGKAVVHWMNKGKISLERLLIITDDIHLDFGALRISEKGSDGGHNGLKNVQEVLNTSSYARLRFGIGNSFSKGKQVEHVLGEWTEEELSMLPSRLTKAAESAISFGLNHLQHTMFFF